MTRQSHQAASAEVLPSMGNLGRMGNAEEQFAWQDRAWTMLEPFVTNSGFLRNRLANTWLGSQGWRVQMVPQYKLTGSAPEWLESLLPGLRRAGHRFLLGTVVEEGLARHSAVWKLPIDADSIGRFFEAHYAIFHMMFPADLSFAVHANDGDYAIIAGPEPLVRSLLAPEEIGAAATARVVEDIEEEHGPGCIDGILEHYAPFMLD